MAVLFFHLGACRLVRCIDTLQSLLVVTIIPEKLLLTLVTDLPGHLLTVLGVAVLLSLLWASLQFQLTDFLWLKVTVLLLHWEGEDVGEFLAIPVDISLAHLHLDLK